VATGTTKQIVRITKLEFFNEMKRVFSSIIKTRTFLDIESIGIDPNDRSQILIEFKEV